MFLDFYQLREQPFVVTPDARFLYLSGTHGEALASLIYGVECDRGFLTLVAAPGMGKTTLVFRLLEHLGNTVRSAFLLQPESSALDVLRALVLDLGVEAACPDAFAMRRELNKLLVAEAERGRRVLVVIDEAQDWSDDVLESVRLLSNFETPARKLIQFVLTGQPALAKRLLHPSLVQLRQRISITARLEPFTAEETDDYIDHRLAVAGYAGGELFDREARASIARIGGGIPRNINNLCFNALSLGFATRSRVIDASIIREVAADLNFASLAAVTLRPAPVADAGKTFGVVAAPEADEREAQPPPAAPVSALAPAPPARHGQGSRTTRWRIAAGSVGALGLLGGMFFTHSDRLARPSRPGYRSVASGSAVARNSKPSPSSSASDSSVRRERRHSRRAKPATRKGDSTPRAALELIRRPSHTPQGAALLLGFPSAAPSLSGGAAHFLDAAPVGPHPSAVAALDSIIPASGSE